MGVVEGFSCSCCNYYFKDEEDRSIHLGQCRYNPPVRVMIGARMPSVFPEVRPEHWCGKWKARGWLRQLERGEL